MIDCIICVCDKRQNNWILEQYHSKYYSDFGDLKNAITNCLSQTDSTHKQKLDSLLTLRFQRFEKAQFLEV